MTKQIPVTDPCAAQTDSVDPMNTPYYSANYVRQTTASTEIVLLHIRQSAIIIRVVQCLWFSLAEM